MVRQESDDDEAKVDSPEPARKPWAAPRLTVSPIGVSTLAAAATTDDGTDGNLLS